MSKSESAKPGAEAGGAPRAHILVVDDDHQAVDIISRLLALRGYRTFTATKGQEGLRIARAEPVDVIVLDVMMPGIDGLTVCAELGKHDATRSIPVILLTGKDDHETRAAGMRLGVSEFLTKPVNKHELYTRIETQLHGRDLARKIDETLARLPKE